MDQNLFSETLTDLLFIPSTGRQDACVRRACCSKRMCLFFIHLECCTATEDPLALLPKCECDPTLSGVKLTTFFFVFLLFFICLFCLWTHFWQLDYWLIISGLGQFEKDGNQPQDTLKIKPNCLRAVIFCGWNLRGLTMIVCQSNCD